MKIYENGHILIVLIQCAVFLPKIYIFGLMNLYFDNTRVVGLLIDTIEWKLHNCDGCLVCKLGPLEWGGVVGMILCTKRIIGQGHDNILATMG